ncbi:MAG: TolC family protein [Candidatus Omnitrophica bacterium]|nr:TolC family protein [Candidatus Omnitrophota bacterium]
MIKFSKTSAKLLKFFYANPQEAFYIQQIGRMLKVKPGVFQRALYNMEKDGILKSEYRANARFFSINKNYPFYKELKTILYKSRVALAAAAFLIPCFCFCNVQAFAQADKSPVVLTSLEDACKIAYKNNKDIQIQEQEAKVASAAILGARSAFLPDVNLNAAYTRRGAVLNQNLVPSKKDSGIFSGYKNDNQLGVSIGQLIYDGGASIANLRENQVAALEQVETFRATKLNVELDTKRLYYGLLLAYETKRIAEDLVAQAQGHYKNVKHRFEQGTASKFDALQSKVQVSLLIPQLVNALNAIDLIMAELNQVLGLRIQDIIKVDDLLDYEPIEIQEDEFLKLSYLNKPEMILSSLGIDMSKWSVKFARAGWFPQINAGAGYNFRSGNNTNMFNNRHSNWDVGVSMTLPLFDGFATKAKVDAAKAKLQEAMISKGKASDEIAVSVRQACIDIKQAQAVIDSQRDNLEDAKEALRIAEVRFDNGIGINLDVLDAQVSLAQVEENLAQGVYDYIMAKASLDRNMGVEVLKEETNEKKD